MLYMQEVAYSDNHTEVIHKDSILKLAQIANLKNNWDGYGAAPIPPYTLYFALQLICSLHEQPEIFPTATGAIQFEYEKDNGDYLEFLFTGNGQCDVFRIVDNSEEYFTSQDNPNSINSIIDNFYEHSI